MKNQKLILSVVGLLLSITTFGQNPYVVDANNQLRHIFSQITYPDNDVLLLYDRSVKLGDSTFYSNNSPDTLNNQVWRQLYEEVYYSAHDTLPFETLADIQTYSNQFYGDTIPIALMDYDFYYCKDVAITTGNYFIFDTVNNILYDHTSPIGSPYGRSNLFVGSPMREFSDFANPVFRIDPNLFFTDNVNAPYYLNTTSVRINFDDGTGWHYFDMGLLSHYQAAYTAEGRHIIQIELLDKKRKTIKSSKSDFMVLKSASAVEPDVVMDIEGLQVGVFHGCGDGVTEKVVIFLEGIDILDMVPAWGRGLDDIYYDMINSEYIEELRNFNYTFYVVNWKNSRIDMRFNALYVVNLIETLKKKYQSSGEQFVIIGESMGGVIGRYALTFMESKEYQSNNYTNFFADAAVPQNALYLALNSDLLTLGNANRDFDLDSVMHKTRELITLDSPHQGANIPLSVQHAYRKLFGLVVPAFQYITSMTNLGLEGYAARQLLIYHIDGKANPFSNTSTYYGDPAHYKFYGQLEKIGNYPRYCKLVALSSGAMNGANQEGVLGTRVPSDLLLDFSSQLYGRIFWIKVPLLKVDYELRTNPNGSGTFYSAAIGNFTLKIKLKWFGVKITNIYGNLYSDNQIALSVKPHCVSAGGYFSTGIEIGANTTPSSYNLSKNWLFNLFSYNLNVSGGCVTLNSHVGWQGFSSTNLDFSLCSDGTDFGFVPLQSALDYGKGLNMPLNHDIMAENINTKLSRTPFDVIVAYPDGVNSGHLYYRDELIYNVTATPAVNCLSYFPNGKFAYYDADLLHECEVKRSFLCLEIGDEEMYMENWELNRGAKFQSEYDLYVNKRNPYYQYPSTMGTPLLNLGAIYSKEAPFLITPDGFASFISYQTGSPTGVGFDYSNPQNPSLWEENEIEMKVCMEDYASGKSISIDETETGSESLLNQGESLKLYPNPNDGNLLMVEYEFLSTESVNLQIVDVAGKTIFESGSLDGGKNKATLNLEGLNSGVYLVNILGNNRKMVSRLIIR